MKSPLDAMTIILLVIAARKRRTLQKTKALPGHLSFKDRLITLINHQVVVFTGSPHGLEGILTSVSHDFVTIYAKSTMVSAVFIPIRMISSIHLKFQTY